MKHTSMLALFSMLLLALSLSLTSCTRIGPGHVGIKVDMAGSSKGVEDVPTTTGWTFYFPPTTTVIEYPVFVQTAVWTKDVSEGKPQNEEITFNSKEGLVISGDVNLSYQLAQDKVPQFYVKFRQDNLDNFTHGFMRNLARDAFSAEATNYTVEEIYASKKEELLVKVKARINKEINPFGVTVEQFGFIGALRIPENVLNSLNMKIQATQDAIRVENEIRMTEAEAKKKIVAAEADAKVQQLLTQTLTPAMLEKMKIEKWDGALPQVQGGATPFLNISK